MYFEYMNVSADHGAMNFLLGRKKKKSKFSFLKNKKKELLRHAYHTQPCHVYIYEKKVHTHSHNLTKYERAYFMCHV